MFSVKVTFTMISSWQVHISTIFEQYFQQFFLATFLPPKPNPLRVIGAPLHGGLREKEGDSRCPLQLCIYLRVCLFVKKVPISSWFLHQWHLLSATLEWQLRPARIENTGELLLVLSILVSLLATPSRLVNRLKIVLSPPPPHSGEKSTGRHFHKSWRGSSNIHPWFLFLTFPTSSCETIVISICVKCFNFWQFCAILVTFFT